MAALTAIHLVIDRLIMMEIVDPLQTMMFLMSYRLRFAGVLAEANQFFLRIKLVFHRLERVVDNYIFGAKKIWKNTVFTVFIMNHQHALGAPIFFFL